MATQPLPEAGARERHYGKYRGTVVSNLDPLQQGRIQALVPELLGPVPTGWATPCAPVAGPLAGFFSVPIAGAGVWIEFEAGDISRPIWTGGYWAAGETPGVPPLPEPPLPTTKVWRSDLGYTVAMDDLKQAITLTDPLGTNRITIDVATATVTISGLARVVLDAPLVQEGSGSAFHPGVHGDQLLLYLSQLVALFNTHVHPGELAAGFLPVTPAPPVAPMPPPSPSLVSTRVFLD
ncbi:MAG: phage baseplate assembly protein V [Sphingomonadaceae bacterium]